jgi:uncharacterized membrane protein
MLKPQTPRIPLLQLGVLQLFYSFGYNWAYDKVFPLAATMPLVDAQAKRRLV